MRFSRIVAFFVDELLHGRRIPNLLVESLRRAARELDGRLVSSPVEPKTALIILNNAPIAYSFDWSDAHGTQATLRGHAAVCESANSLSERQLGASDEEVDWIWFADLIDGFPTSYNFKFLKSKGAFIWSVGRVGKARGRFSEPNSKRSTCEAFSAQLVRDMTQIGGTLTANVAAED
jgi:hypothetical protein